MTTGDSHKGSDSQHRLSDQVSANTDDIHTARSCRGCPTAWAPDTAADRHRVRESETWDAQHAKGGHARDRCAAQALVWEDDQGKVWLTYNSAEYLQTIIYPRHGLPPNPDAVKAGAAALAKFAESATQ